MKSLFFGTPEFAVPSLEALLSVASVPLVVTQPDRPVGRHSVPRPSPVARRAAEAGIPVESARGPHGGYRIGRGMRLPPVVFTEAEALGLVMAVLDGQPDADDLVGSALGKVIQALPDSVGRQAAVLREHASTAPDRRSARPDPATTSALVAAVAARHRVVISYRSESGNVWESEVDPWAVVVRHGRWYLLCHSHRAGAVRVRSVLLRIA